MPNPLGRGLVDRPGLRRAFARSPPVESLPRFLGGLSRDLAGLTHVPFSPLSERRFHLLGGRMRTGGANEYGVAWGVVLFCWALSGHIAAPGGGGYLPFFRTGRTRYEDGTATAKEWRDSQFRFL
jgi:inner membrane protein